MKSEAAGSPWRVSLDRAIRGVSPRNPERKESISFLQITSVFFVILLIETLSPTLRILLIFCYWKRRYAHMLLEILGSWYFDKPNWRLEFYRRPELTGKYYFVKERCFRTRCTEFKNRSIAPTPSYVYIYMHRMMKQRTWYSVITHRNF